LVRSVVGRALGYQGRRKYRHAKGNASKYKSNQSHIGVIQFSQNSNPPASVRIAAAAAQSDHYAQPEVLGERVKIPVVVQQRIPAFDARVAITVSMVLRTVTPSLRKARKFFAA